MESDSQIDVVELELDSNKFPTDRYQALKQIGKGAAGTVYLCRDKLLGGKLVAIKCLHAATPEQLVDFQKEAKAMSSLIHPGILSVLDFGSTGGGTPYMVMEYVEGQTLQTYLEERGAMPVSTALVVFKRIAEVLSFAHEHGIFHRDVKSSNILLVGDLKEPEIKLIDFGVASMNLASMQTTIVQGNTIVGTPGYMPPDQARGLPYNELSEIYALGCLMFEALTGRLPFAAESALETIALHAQEPPPRLKDVRSDLSFSPQLEMIVARCLEKRPQDRYRSMNALLEAFDSPDIHGAAFEAQSDKPRLRKQALVAGVALLLIGAAVGINYAYQYASRPVITTKLIAPHQDENVDHILLDLPVMEVPHKVLRTYDRAYETLEIRYGSDEDLRKEIQLNPEYREKTYRLSLYGGKYTKKGLGALNGTQVQSLRLRNLKLPDSIFDGVSNLPVFNDLYVYNCSFNGDMLKMFKSAPFETISFVHSNLKDDAFESIKNNRKLYQLKVERCPTFTGAGFRYLTESPIQTMVWQNYALGNEDLEFTERWTVYPVNGLQQLAKFPSLHNLVLSTESVDDTSIVELGKFKHLSNLRFLGKGLLKANLMPLKNLKTLRLFTYEGESLTDAQVAVLQKAMPLCKFQRGYRQTIEAF